MKFWIGVAASVVLCGACSSSEPTGSSGSNTNAAGVFEAGLKFSVSDSSQVDGMKAYKGESPTIFKLVETNTEYLYDVKLQRTSDTADDILLSTTYMHDSALEGWVGGQNRLIGERTESIRPWEATGPGGHIVFQRYDKQAGAISVEIYRPNGDHAASIPIPITRQKYETTNQKIDFDRAVASLGVATWSTQPGLFAFSTKRHFNDSGTLVLARPGVNVPDEIVLGKVWKLEFSSDNRTLAVCSSTETGDRVNTLVNTEDATLTPIEFDSDECFTTFNNNFVYSIRDEFESTEIEIFNIKTAGISSHPVAGQKDKKRTQSLMWLCSDNQDLVVGYVGYGVGDHTDYAFDPNTGSFLERESQNCVSKSTSPSGKYWHEKVDGNWVVGEVGDPAGTELAGTADTSLVGYTNNETALLLSHGSDLKIVNIVDKNTPETIVDKFPSRWFVCESVAGNIVTKSDDSFVAFTTDSRDLDLVENPPKAIALEPNCNVSGLGDLIGFSPGGNYITASSKTTETTQNHYVVYLPTQSGFEIGSEIYAWVEPEI